MSGRERDVRFSELAGFTDKQREATRIADTHLFTLFGGSRGPGKSYWLRWYLLRLAIRFYGVYGIRGARVMLACEDYPNLYERQISKIEVEFPAFLGHYNRGRNEFTLDAGLGDGVVAFRNLDKPGKYQSAEFAAIGVDELARNPRRTFHVLRGSLRWPGVERPVFVAASNPAANWVRDFWLEHRLPGEMAGLENEFAFVPGLPDDNPHLPESYTQQLDTLPGALRRAWRYGDWYAAVEGLVFDTFSEANITDAEPDPAQPVELAIDDGYIDPRATLFIQRTPSHILVFDELYQTKTLEEQTIDGILAKCEANRWPVPELAVVSHEAVALRTRLRRANIAARNWLSRRASGRGTSTRIEAINLTRSLFCDGQGHRTLLIHRRCTNLLDEITAGYRYPEGRRGLSEKPVDGNDHACEALESWCWYRCRA